MKNKAFTLLELLLVVAIIGLLTFSVVANFRQAQRFYAAQRAAQKISQAFRRTQNLAISGKIDSALGFPDGGYGLKISKDVNTLIIFADRNNDQIYNAPSELEETIIIEEPIKIRNIIHTNPDTPTDFYVTFIPPNPLEDPITPSSGTLRFNPPRNLSYSYISIELTWLYDVTAVLKTINIYGSGLVEIK